MDRFHDEAGLVGLAGHPQAGPLAHRVLHALQHRGEQAAGLVVTDGVTPRVWRGQGLVQDVFAGPVLPALTGTVAIGAVARLAGVGRRPDPVTGMEQPIVARVRGVPVAIALTGRFTNGQRLRARLSDRGAAFTTTTDAEVLLHQMAGSVHRTPVNRLVDALHEIEGAYSLVLAIEERLVAVRDPRGFRPLVLGRVDGAWAVASDEAALRFPGAEVVRDVEPGEMIIVDDTAVRSVSPFATRPRSQCVHELVALAPPASRVFGRPAHPLRQALGERLASEQPAPRADVVVALPDAAAAASGYARAARLPLQPGLERAAYGAPVWSPTAEQELDAGDLVAVPTAVADRRVVLVAPTLATGEEVRAAVRLLRRAGAAEVHVRVASPPIRAACLYGVASPSNDEIASTSPEGLVALTQRLLADSLAFLSAEGLRAVVAEGDAVPFCDGCFTTTWPLPPETDDQLPLFR